MARSKQKGFKSFPKLPIEVRLMVWKLLIRPRILEIHDHKRTMRVRSGSVPVVLRINQESRKEALRSYKLVYDEIRPTDPYYQFLYKRVRNQIYANFSMDTFYFGTRCYSVAMGGLFAYTYPDGPGGDYSSELQHVAYHHQIARRTTFQLAQLDCNVEQELVKHKNLSTVTVVLDTMLPKEPGRCEFVDPKVWEREGEPTGTGRREYCTKRERDDSLHIFKDLFERMKEKHPEWKEPTTEGKSLVKRRVTRWLG